MPLGLRADGYAPTDMRRHPWMNFASRWSLFLQPQPRETAAKHELRKSAVKVERAALLGGLIDDPQLCHDLENCQGLSPDANVYSGDSHLGVCADCNQEYEIAEPHDYRSDNRVGCKRAVSGMVMSHLARERMSLKVEARCAPCRILKRAPKTKFG